MKQVILGIVLVFMVETGFGQTFDKTSSKHVEETAAWNQSMTQTDSIPIHEIQYTFFLQKAKSGTVGYSIYKNGTPIIYQNTIPSQSGTLGFACPEKAKKCAQLVIEKLKKSNELPSLSAQEIAQL